MKDGGLIQQIDEYKQQIAELQEDVKILSEREPWLNVVLAKSAIKRLESQNKKLKAEIERAEIRHRESYSFEYEVRRFIVRFESRKWDSEFPIQRITEAVIHLKEKLP